MENNDDFKFDKYIDDYIMCKVKTFHDLITNDINVRNAKDGHDTTDRIKVEVLAMTSLLDILSEYRYATGYYDGKRAKDGK